jgi:hypothetical protein
MADIKVALINESTVLQDNAVEAILPALQKQVSRDLAPAWGVDADLIFIPRGQQPPSGTWWLVVLDSPDQAGMMGYHDLSNGGLPLGKVFAKADIERKLKWTVTVSHELLEMLVDPAINLAVFQQPGTTGGKLYSCEICDPCEADQYGYEIDGVTVADFVYPAWFQPFRPPGSRFDHLNKIQKPFEVLPGGYIGVCELGAGGSWYQVAAEKDPLSYHMRARPGSRRERRRTPGNQWMKSEVRWQQAVKASS